MPEKRRSHITYGPDRGECTNKETYPKKMICLLAWADTYSVKKKRGVIKKVLGWQKQPYTKKNGELGYNEKWPLDGR